MDEMFEPRKKERLDKSFFKGFIFLFILGVFLIVGTSYSLEFFRANKNVGTINLRLGAISVSVTGDNTFNTTLTKQSDSDGITNGLVKTLTITNNNTILANYILKLERTSGVELSNLKYCLMINNVIQKVDTVPSDGVLFNNIILGNETLNAKVTLWIDNNYTGSDLTFNGTISSEIKRTYNLSSDVLEDVIDFDNITTSTNNYVSFNNETYRIVKIEDDRLVICKNADFDSTASSRVNSNKYNSSLTYTDNSIIYSHSTDNKNLYLVKTVNIKSGKGTSTDPFILENNREYAGDKKALAYITYKDGSTTLFTQPIYYNQTNYISYVKNDPDFIGWSTTNGGTTVDYELGDTVSFTTDTNLYAVTPYVTLTSGCYTIKGNILTNEAEITNYSCLSCTSKNSSNADVNVNIPSSIEGYIITSIGNLSFRKYCSNGGDVSNLGGVTIPNTVTSIGNGAFRETHLASVIIPDSVISIGEDAFANGYGLTSLTLGSGLTTIGSHAFSGHSITNLTIPSNVVNVGTFAFNGSWSNLTINSSSLDGYEQISYTSTTGSYVWYKSRLYSVFGSGDTSKSYNVTIGTPSIPPHFMDSNSLGNYSLTLLDSVTSIGVEAFSDGNISSLSLGTGVTTISNGAFTETNLSSLTIPSNVKNIGECAFADNNITSLTIQNGVETIGDAAFSTCRGNSSPNLGNLVIPNSVETIGNYAFAGAGITSLTLGNSVETIGSYAFAGRNDNYDYSIRNTLTTVTIPDSVTSLGEYAFQENDLTSVTIGDGLTTISDEAFYANLITSIQFGSSVQVIGESAFEYNKLTTLTIPDTVTDIMNDAFNNNSLTSLNLGSNVENIYSSAFYNSELDYTDNGIPRYYGPNNLSTVNLPNTIQNYYNVFADGVVLTMNNNYYCTVGDDC